MGKKERRLKLQTDYRMGTSQPKYYPLLLLKGKWLQESGFEEETYVKVRVEKNRLIIEPIADNKV